MPKRKTTKKKSGNGLDSLKNFDTKTFFSGNKSYMSLAYGVVTVVVIFVIIFLGVRALSNREAEVTEEATQTEEQSRTYTVEAGDNLWTIAEEVYNDGYQWAVIAEANDLASPDAIETGMELTIPEITPTEVATAETAEEASDTPVVEEETVEEQATPSPRPAEDAAPTITGNEYTVVTGDHLWGIAVRAYGDGYKWVEIARANNIANPDLIYPGQKFSLPR